MYQQSHADIFPLPIIQVIGFSLALKNGVSLLQSLLALFDSGSRNLCS
jgi:hypothetical protein